MVNFFWFFSFDHTHTHNDFFFLFLVHFHIMNRIGKMVQLTDRIWLNVIQFNELIQCRIVIHINNIVHLIYFLVFLVISLCNAMFTIIKCINILEYIVFIYINITIGKWIWKHGVNVGVRGTWMDTKCSNRNKIQRMKADWMEHVAKQQARMSSRCIVKDVCLLESRVTLNENRFDQTGQ